MAKVADVVFFSRNLSDGSHHRRFEVERTPSQGWRVREQSETEVIRQSNYNDWHRVELAIRGFAVEAAELTRLGWQDV